MAGIVLWVPMLEGDDDAAAAEQAGSWPEERVCQWWDGAKELSRLFERSLGLHSPAWDVYLLYPPGVHWEGDVPPTPTFWMHQLSDPAATPNLLLSRDPSRLSRELDLLVHDSYSGFSSA